MPTLIHLTFDLLAAGLAMVSGWLVYGWRFRDSLPRMTRRIGPGYFLALGLGSIAGAYFLGTLNMVVSGLPGLGRSILGALTGAIAMVELYKWRKGAAGSTGYVYVIPFCVSVSVGRLGCFLSGLDDFTHGTPTDLPWGWDYGDGILRHPVQLYESAAMAFAMGVFLAILATRPHIIIRFGFYLCVGWYATQRFAWEFFKPYGGVAGQLNIFHIVCLLLLIYTISMIVRTRGG